MTHSIMTWGKLKALAASEGMADDAPFLIDTGEDDGDLKNATIGLYCPIASTACNNDDNSNDSTGFFVVERTKK